MKNGLEDYYVIRGNKKMRFGYTTGSCAAAACKGAAEILLGGVMHKAVTLMTPKGILLTLELKDIRIEGNQVTCAIRRMQEMIRILQTEYWFMPQCRRQKSRESSLTEVLAWEG